MPDPTDEQIRTMRNDPAVGKAVEGVHALEDLRESTGWQYLKRRFTNYQQGVVEALAKRLLRGEKIEDKELGFVMGYAAAVVDLLQVPERVDEELENAAERAYRRLLEQEAESEETPPYQ